MVNTHAQWRLSLFIAVDEAYIAVDEDMSRLTRFASGDNLDSRQTEG